MCTRLCCPVTCFIIKLAKYSVGDGGFVRQVQIKDHVTQCRLCRPLHDCEGRTLHPTEKQKWTYHERIRFTSGKLPRQAVSCNMLILWVCKWLFDGSYARSQRSLWSSQEISMLRSALKRRTLPITSIRLSLWDGLKFLAWICCAVYI